MSPCTEHENLVSVQAYSPKGTSLRGEWLLQKDIPITVGYVHVIRHLRGNWYLLFE